MPTGHVIAYGPLDPGPIPFHRLGHVERQVMLAVCRMPIECIWHQGFSVAAEKRYAFAIPLSVDALREREKPAFLAMNYAKWRTIHAAKEVTRAGQQSVVPVAVCRSMIRWADKATAIRHAIILANAGLAYRVANSRAAPQDYDDCQSEAMATLCRAVDLFNADNGSRFSPYAFLSMLRAIIRAMTKAKRFAAIHGEANTLHFMTPENGDADSERIDLRLLIDDNEARLTGLEHDVIAMRFGLDGYSAHTMGATAKRLSISAALVSEVQAVAIRKLRDAFGLPEL